MAVSFFQTLIKENPDVPAWQELTLAEEQSKAITANKKAFTDVKPLASDFNQFAQSELLKQLRGILPDLDKQIGAQSNLISDLLAGVIPHDVSEQVQSSAAARALGAGIGGSNRHGNLLARDLGLTSLGLQSQGMDSFNRWLAQGRQYLTAPQFDVSSMFVSPTQMYQVSSEERNNLWNYRKYKAQMDAQPEPWAAAFANLGDSVIDAALSYFSFGGGDGAETPNIGGVDNWNAMSGSQQRQYNKQLGWAAQNAGGPYE